MTRACAIHQGQVAVRKRLLSIVRANGQRLEVGAVHALLGRPGCWKADTDDGPRWVWLVDGKMVVSRADPRGGTRLKPAAAE